MRTSLVGIPLVVALSLCSPACVTSELVSSFEGDCGDGRIDSGEVCDDDNTQADDGCSVACALEAGWQCSGEPSVCRAICGDGAVVGPETCDQGAADEPPSSGDGCSAGCQREIGWGCSNEPSICSFLCGNGELNSGEHCDDGNRIAGDGCSPDCLIEGDECDDVAAPTCGDSDVEICEPCDDGNEVTERPADEADSNAAWTGCPRDCSVAFSTCGDGTIDPGEQCDDGAKQGDADIEFNADQTPDLDQSCSTSCTSNQHTVGAPCYSTAAELAPSDPNFSNFAHGLITGCGNLPTVDPSIGEHACARSMPSVIGDLFFAGGYCTFMAMSCMCDYDAVPDCDLDDFPGLCSITPAVGNTDAFDESVCPKGSVFIIIDQHVADRIVRTNICVETCESEADCRWHQWDPVFETWGQYHCLPQIMPDITLSDTTKICVDCRTFELVAHKDCLTLEDLPENL